MLLKKDESCAFENEIKTRTSKPERCGVEITE
jgi:hypothetical protein